MKKSGADIVVADCGLGNLHSVAAALGRVSPGADIRVSRDPAEVEKAAKVVLPGDGHFDACAREIRARGMESALRRAAREKPFFGVCVGMQILYESSDEGDEKGLGIFPGRIRRIPDGGGRKIPHMGWNEIRPRRPHPILAGMENGKAGAATAEGTGEGGGGGEGGVGVGARFYFIHSFYAPPGLESVATAEYGLEMTAVAASGLLVASQFHPEKSGRRGLRMLANFAHPEFGQAG